MEKQRELNSGDVDTRDERDTRLNEKRRDFLKRAGKYAAYTPPAVMMLMKPGFAAINKSFVGRPPAVVPGQPGAKPPSGDPRTK